PHRGPEAQRDTVAHLSSYIFHDLTTPLGQRLDRCRRGPSSRDAPVNGADVPTPFRSFGTYAVWFPRGLMLRMAARQACGRWLADWQATAEPTASAEIEAACARALADPDLRFESICAQIEEGARVPSEGAPAEVLAGVLAGLEEQSLQGAAQDDPGGWARQAIGRMREWIGGGSNSDDGSEWRKSRLSRALWNAAQQLAEQWDNRLGRSAFTLLDHPRRRLRAA